MAGDRHGTARSVTQLTHRGTGGLRVDRDQLWHSFRLLPAGRLVSSARPVSIQDSRVDRSSCSAAPANRNRDAAVTARPTLVLPRRANGLHLEQLNGHIVSSLRTFVSLAPPPAAVT